MEAEIRTVDIDGPGIFDGRRRSQVSVLRSAHEPLAVVVRRQLNRQLAVRHVAVVVRLRGRDTRRHEALT